MAVGVRVPPFALLPPLNLERLSSPMPLDASKLEVSLKEEERWRRILHITVPWSLVEAERKAQVRELATTLDLPGFRAGRVPDAVVEKRFRHVVDERAVGQVTDEAFRCAVREHSLHPITQGEIGAIRYAAGSDLSFDVSFDVQPDIELARTGGFRVQRPATRVPEEQVAAFLDEIRTRVGTWVPEEAGRPGDGDQVSVRIQDKSAGEDEGTPYEFVLGRGEAIPNVEAAVLSLEVGERGDFTIRFPERPSEAEREEIQVTISLDGRKRLELPELDDDLAASASDFETLEELRDDIRKQLWQEADRRAEAVLHRELAEQILAANPFEVPDSMVERSLAKFLASRGEMTEEEASAVREQLRPQLVQGLKHQIMIDRVAKSEGLAASPEEIDAQVEAVAAGYKLTVRETYARLQKSGRLEEIEKGLTEKNVFEHLKTQSEITASA